jgi:hypothetical protein
MRLLFASIHCYLDPSSGAALCTRELLELLAGRGMDCRVLTTGVLDPERETSLDEMLATPELPARRFQAALGSGRTAEVIDLGVNGVRVTVMPTESSGAELPVPRATWPSAIAGMCAAWLPVPARSRSRGCQAASGTIRAASRKIGGTVSCKFVPVLPD